MGAKPASRQKPGDVRRRRVRDRLNAPSQFFRGLDGHELTVGRRTWNIEVYSVRDRGGSRWVQLALVGIPDHVLALRLAKGDSARVALRALMSWLMKPGTKSDILAAPPRQFPNLMISSHADGVTL